MGIQAGMPPCFCGALPADGSSGKGYLGKAGDSRESLFVSLTSVIVDCGILKTRK
jgi:hypothetical protein